MSLRWRASANASSAIASAARDDVEVVAMACSTPAMLADTTLALNDAAPTFC